MACHKPGRAAHSRPPRSPRTRPIYRYAGASIGAKCLVLPAAVLPQYFPSTRYLEYAEAVETYTLQKAPNLVLNVDGCIAAIFLDLLAASGCFSEAEAAAIVDIGYLNALFVVARSIGLVRGSTSRLAAGRVRCCCLSGCPPPQRVPTYLRS